MDIKNKIELPEADVLFEVSFEICNKVGGIYTVITSKATEMKKFYKDNYFLIGPYLKNNQDIDFIEKEVPDKFKNIVQKLNEKNIQCHYGVWKLKTEQEVILIDYKGLVNDQDQYKKLYWDKFKVDSLFAKWDFIEPLLWSTACGMFIEEYKNEFNNKKVVGHFHEWISGFGALWLKSQGSKVGTVFTTHATMLGRSIAGSGQNLYDIINYVNPFDEARRLNVMDKFTAEKACSHFSDVFTTVSEITNIEAKKLLGKEADFLVLNGINNDEFPSFEKTSITHTKTRDKLRDFLISYFNPYYDMDFDHNLIYFAVGRYEFRNKGLDVFIKSLGKLDKQLRNDNSERTVTAILWIPGNPNGIKKEVLENKLYYERIKSHLNSDIDNIKKKIIKGIISQKEIKPTEIFTEEFLLHNKQNMEHFKRDGNAPLSTHNLNHEENDQILNELKNNNLINSKDNKVKVILYPIYLTGADGLMDVTYYEALCGSHLGVLGSYYEPWGYTPVECAIMGTPAITTNLAGFGRFIKDKTTNNQGIKVLDRFNKSDEEVTENLYNELYSFSKLTHKERVNEKIKAKELTEFVDWKIFISNYIKSHNKAIHKIK